MAQVTCNDDTFISFFNAKFQDGIPVRPIENTIHSPTTKIFKFLDKILRPIFDDKCKTTTIVDGASLINELHKYIKKGLFKLSTLFCTMNIRNLYTMLPQEKALEILGELLDVHNYTKVKGIDLNTIKELASIVLNNTEKHDVKSGDRIVVHYTHEKRLHSFKRYMHRMYDDTFQNPTEKGIRMIVGNRNRRDAQRELIHKRPKQSILKNRSPKQTK